MSKFSKVLLALICSFCLAFGVFAAAACNDTGNGGNNGGNDPESYTVTLTYGDGYSAEMGTAELDPEADDDKYEENTVVKVVVHPNTGYEVDSVTANDEDVDEDSTNPGSYPFTVTEDTEVVVTFKATALQTSPLTLAEKYEGTYYRQNGSDVDENDKIVVSAENVMWNSDVVFLIESEDNEETYFAVMVDDVVYAMLLSDNEITLMDSEFNTYSFVNAASLTDTYTVSVSFADPEDNGHAQVVINPDKTAFEEGDTITVTVTVEEDYELETFVVNGGENETATSHDGNVYVFTLTVDGNLNIVIDLKDTKSYTVEIDYYDEMAGTVFFDTEPNGEGEEKYLAGTEVKVIVMAYEGYAIDTVQANGVDLTANPDNPGEYTVKVITDTTITVTFKVELNIVGNLTVDAKYAGEYVLSTNPNSKIVINEEGGVMWDSDVVLEVENEDNGEDGYWQVSIDDVLYSFHIMDNGTIQLTDPDWTVYEFSKADLTFPVVIKYSYDDEDVEEGDIATYIASVVFGEEGEGPFASGTQVTITITVNAAYEIGTVTIPGYEDLSVSNDGTVCTITFTVEAGLASDGTNIVISVSLKDATTA